VPALSHCPGAKLVKIVSQVTVWCARDPHLTGERRRSLLEFGGAVARVHVVKGHVALSV
jgi:hypothetical protein